MCIAGAIVHDIVFSKVEQFFTVVEQPIHTAVALCRLLGKDAIVVCGSGPKGLELIKHDASRFGLDIQAASRTEVRIMVGSQMLTVLAETDAAESKVSTVYLEDPLSPDEPVDWQPVQEKDIDPAARAERRAVAEQTYGSIGQAGSKGSGKGGKGGKGGHGDQRDQAKEEPQPEATIAVPLDAADAGLIIVIGGQFLRETASLSKVICSVCGRGRPNASVPMFHLVSDVRQVLVETEEEAKAVTSVLAADGSAKTTVELPGQPCVPAGAVVMAEADGNSKESNQLPAIMELPAILNFKLRMVSLGLVTRLRDRYGCAVSELFYNVLECLLSKSD
jgi:hypothetical protein